MTAHALAQAFIALIIKYASDFLLPGIILIGIVGGISRVLIFVTIRRQQWYVREIEKRVDRFLGQVRTTTDVSFFVSCKQVLERTYYELFEVRAIMMRRKPDLLLSLIDRIFVVQQGCARVVRDTLGQVRHLRYQVTHPKMREIALSVLSNNRCFNRVFGLIPVQGLNDLLNLLPGIFIISGIFGTFIGIMQALPDLGTMDIASVESSKATIDSFLLKTSYAMSSSILGICLCVWMNVMNAVFSPNKIALSSLNMYENGLDKLWHRATNNLLPEEISDFNEHRDPIEALAEQAVDIQMRKIRSGGGGAAASPNDLPSAG